MRFFCFRPEIPSYWENLVQKIEISVEAEIQYQDQFEQAKFNGNVRFFCFRPEMPFLGKFGQKNPSGQFKLKFGAKTNSNMQNSIAMLNFSIFGRK